MNKSDNEAWFDRNWLFMGGPTPEEEYRFHPSRKWRFDRAWPDKKVALEVEGKGHAKWNRYHSDIEKYNEAARLGWTVIRLSFLDIGKEDFTTLDILKDVLDKEER